jgi:tetratricopeptide (TPR) repeat protein
MTFPLIPTRDDIRQLASAREGNLADVPFSVLLLALATEGKSAVVELRRNALEKQIVLDDGVPVDCRSNIATESLGRFLVSIGKLAEADYQTALSAAASRHLAVEDILAERRLVDAAELYRILQQNLGRKLLDAFTWKSGTFQVSSDVPPVDSPLRVKAAQLILTGVLKFEAQERVDAAIETVQGRFLTAGSSPLFPLDDLRLNPEQSKVVTALRRGGDLATIRAATALPEDEADRLLYTFLLLGVAGVTSAQPAKVPALELELELPEPPALPPPAAATPAGTPLRLEVELPLSPPPFMRDDSAVRRPAAPASSLDDSAVRRPPAAAPADESLAASRDELMRTYISFKRKDAYELLGIEETASIGTVVRAYMKFAEAFLPSRFGDPEGSDSMREKAQEIFLAGARAYGELADPDRRAALLARRAKRRESPLSPGAAEGPLGKGAMIDPEALYRNGRELSDAGDHREALSYFEMAADVDAQNGTYAAELAWCRFQLMISTANHTLKVLRNAMRIDPNCGAAYLYVGRVHATLGNKLEAEGYIRKSMTLMPRDKRPHEALRSLAAAR